MHGRLVEALERGDLELELRARNLATLRSPVFSIADVALLLAAALLLLAAAGYFGGSELTVPAIAGFGLAVFFWGRWLVQRLKVRAIRFAFASAENWDVLWRTGGVVLKVPGGSRDVCAGPTCDWRRFVREQLLNKHDGREGAA